jgi:hypothetical protein
MSKARMPKCPVCNSAKQVLSIGLSGDMFHCRKCGGSFDGNSEEGGDWDDRDPSRRMERQEARANRAGFRNQTLNKRN